MGGRGRPIENARGRGHGRGRGRFFEKPAGAGEGAGAKSGKSEHWMSVICIFLICFWFKQLQQLFVSNQLSQWSVMQLHNLKREWSSSFLQTMVFLAAQSPEIV